MNSSQSRPMLLAGHLDTVPDPFPPCSRWEDAFGPPLVCAFDESGGMEPSGHAEWFAFHTDRFLGLACRLRDRDFPDLRPGPPEDGPAVVGDDNMSVFLVPARAGIRGIQFALSFSGKRFQWGFGWRNLEIWTHRWGGTAFVADGFHGGFFLFPFDGLGIQPRRGDVWGALLCLQRWVQGAPHRLTHLNAAVTRHIMYPEEFGGIAFGSLPEPELDRPVHAHPRPRNGRNDFLLSITTDFPDDTTWNSFTAEQFERYFAILRGWGFGRVNWIEYGSPSHGGAYIQDKRGMRADNHAVTTYRNIGDVLPAAVQCAHRAGMQLHGIFKPYDMGLATTVPRSHPLAAELGKLQHPGGVLVWLHSALARNPGIRFRRRPPRTSQLPVGEIQILALDDGPIGLSAADLQVWVSDDNATFRAYQGKVRPREDIGERNGKRVRRLLLRELEIPHPFVGITTLRQGRTLAVLPYRSLVVKDTDGQVIDVSATRALLPAGIVGSVRDFRKGGFTVSATENIDWDFLDAPGAFLGFAREPCEYVAGSPHPAEPGAVSLWLSEIERILDAGVDAVDIRFQHHNLTDDPLNYGFNEPFLKAFREKYGVDPATQPFNAEDFIELTSEFHNAFLRRVRQLCSARGRPLYLHADDGPNETYMLPIRMQWRKWIQDGLPDGLTLKHIDPETRLEREASELARERGIPVISSCRPGQLPRSLNDAWRRGMAGFDYYETVLLLRRGLWGSNEEEFVVRRPGDVEALRQFQKERGRAP